MPFFQLILKQMKQRLLSTLLATLSILLGMTLATAILILAREGKNVFSQTDYGFDLLVGPKASPLQLVLNTLYHIDVSPGNIPYKLYEDLSPATADEKYRGLVAWAAPYAVGDSYKGRRIIATTTQLFGVDENGKALPPEKIPNYRDRERYTFAQGRAFEARKFEAVIGAEVAASLRLKIGDTFHATHGLPGPNDVPDEHAESWRVVGILDVTHTANDRVLFIPLITFYAIFEHEEGLGAIGAVKGLGKDDDKDKDKDKELGDGKAYTVDGEGNISVKLPREAWEVSAILVQTRSPAAALRLQFLLRNLPEAVGVMPAPVMQSFFTTFLPVTSTLLLVISMLVTVVGAVSILVSIYNSVAARTREIAVMRALGATRRRILAAVCVEAGLIGVVGGVLGLVCGHGLAAAGSAYLRGLLGTGLPWWRVSGVEGVYLIVVVLLCVLAGVVPAVKAYGVSVAEGLG